MTKIKLICFDLDGVLIDSRELHYQALNAALRSVDERYTINREEHLSTYDGLTTSKKLEMLSELKDLPREHHNSIWFNKQKATTALLRQLPPSEKLRHIFETLHNAGYKICVCSNAIRLTVRLSLLHLGIMEFVDYYYSNEDVNRTKPSGEIYQRAMIDCRVEPNETMIVEDSHVGRLAAINSGGHLLPLRHIDELTMELIQTKLDDLNTSSLHHVKWRGGKMNVLIPMAGAGSRFEKAGYTFPKPLIEVLGKPMIQLVVENLNIDAHYIFIVQSAHYEKYNLKQLLNIIAPKCDIVQVDSLTEGAACTTLLAKQFIDNNQPLVIANSDQYVDWNSNEFMYSMVGDTVDAGMATFTSVHPKWSFARLNESGFVAEVAEKNPISDIATVGIYYWKHGSDYVKYAEQMISKNIRVNNEFYVCPVFNEAIGDGKRVKVFPIPRMWGIGTPEDLDTFLKEHK